LNARPARDRNGAAWLAALLLAGTPSALPAQSAAPLRKTDLVRLLANPLIQRTEIAAVVRRNCLAFQPTERDWSDLRTLGADADVLGSVGECAARRTARRGTEPPAPALVAAFLTPRLAAPAGAEAAAEIQLRRADGAPARGVALVLRAAPRVAAGPPGDTRAVSDDSGLVSFHFAVGRRAGRYRLELLGETGTPLPGKPVIELLVSPGVPAAVEAQPPRLELSRAAPGQTAAGLLVTVRDSFGNAVPNEPIELRPAAAAAIGFAPDTEASDSLGRASFVIRRAALRQPGQLEVRARGVTLATLDAVLVSPAPPPAVPQPRAETPPVPSFSVEFLENPVQRGVVRTRLADALTVQLRSRAGGAAAAGRVVSFRAVNAQVEPDSATTDSAGQVRVNVTLGSKAGIAVVTASSDSVQTADTLYANAAAPFELVLEREGDRVDGGRILVELGVPFSLTLRARDRYGNPVPTVSLAARLEELRRAFNSHPDRRLELLAVLPQGEATVLMFKPVGLGDTDVRLEVGLSATVSVLVVPASRR
jgi:hypothetical protein